MDWDLCGVHTHWKLPCVAHRMTECNGNAIVVSATAAIHRPSGVSPGGDCAALGAALGRGAEAVAQGGEGESAGGSGLFFQSRGVKNGGMVSDREVELRAEVSCERRGPWIALGSRAEFEWTRIRLPIKGLAGELEGLKILHLSDLHATGAWSRGYDRLIERVEAAGADLLLFMGDFVDDKYDHRAALK